MRSAIVVDGLKSTIVQTVDTAFAILDIHFSPHDPSLLCAATSTGALLFCVLDQVISRERSSPRLRPLKTLNLFDESTLVLSFAWHPKTPSVLAATLSTGQVMLINVPRLASAESQHAPPVEVFKHDDQAWIVSFSPEGQIVLSGGDDSTLRATPIHHLDHGEHVCIESNGYDAYRAAQQWLDRKIHGAGVTAILPLLSDQIMVTGSYDDKIRVVQIPDVGGVPKRAKELAECDLGGGVWRIAIIEGPDASSSLMTRSRRSWTLLASCMYSGVRIVKLTDDSKGQWNFQIIAKFEAHQSMNYASGVQPQPQGGTRDEAHWRTVVSTSFYDKLVCIWNYRGDLDPPS